MDKALRNIKLARILLLITVGLSGLTSWWFHMTTTDYGHEIFSTNFFIEITILLLVIFLGLKNRWTRVLIAALTIIEVVIFLMDRPISPDELLMILVFGLRVYILFKLFGRTSNSFYSSTPGHASR